MGIATFQNSSIIRDSVRGRNWRRASVRACPYYIIPDGYYTDLHMPWEAELGMIVRDFEEFLYVRDFRKKQKSKYSNDMYEIYTKKSKK